MKTLKGKFQAYLAPTMFPSASINSSIKKSFGAINVKWMMKTSWTHSATGIYIMRYELLLNNTVMRPEYLDSERKLGTKLVGYLKAKNDESPDRNKLMYHDVVDIMALHRMDSTEIQKMCRIINEECVILGQNALIPFAMQQEDLDSMKSDLIEIACSMLCRDNKQEMLDHLIMTIYASETFDDMQDEVKLRLYRDLAQNLEEKIKLSVAMQEMQDQ